MLDIKKAKNFDGIRGMMPSDEFDKVMYCLDYAINDLKDYESGIKIASQCERIQNVLLTKAYFDTENSAVHVQLSYLELEILTDVIALLCLPSGESEHCFAKCIQRPGTKKWTSRTF